MDTAPAKQPTPAALAKLAKRMADSNTPPHVRFQEWRDAWGMSDGELATLLDVQRPEVNRTRNNVRPASFVMATRIEVLCGIPAVHWCDVPQNVRLSARSYSPAYQPKPKPATVKKRS